MYRQGDILFRPLPSAKAAYLGNAQPRGESLIIAYGEKSGHMHQIKSRAAELYSSGGGTLLKVSEPAEVTHEEHRAVTLPPGVYAVIQQKEYTGADTHRAVDD